jgi:hypothetical protein
LAVEFAFRFHRLLASGAARRTEATAVG